MFLMAFVSAYQFTHGYWNGRACLTETVTKCIAPDGTPISVTNKWWAVSAVVCLVAGLMHAWKRNKKQQGG
jgi:hypothetical protein